LFREQKGGEQEPAGARKRESRHPHHAVGPGERVGMWSSTSGAGVVWAKRNHYRKRKDRTRNYAHPVRNKKRRFEGRRVRKRGRQGLPRNFEVANHFFGTAPPRLLTVNGKR